MDDIVFSGVDEAPTVFSNFQITHAVSFKDHTFYWPNIGHLMVNPDSDWLRFDMYDRYFKPATPEHDAVAVITDRLIEFARALPEHARVGFNCYMGISRSTAAGLITCAVRYPDFEEAQRRFFRARGPCGPNETILEIADERLGLGGKLVAFGDELFLRHQERGGFIAHRRGHPSPLNDPYDEDR